MHRQALDVRKRALGEDHPDVATSLNNIALVLSDQGRLDEALVMHRQALDIRKRALGEDHPGVYATDLNNMARVLYKLGHGSEALEKAERARGIRVRVYGADHWLVADCINTKALAMHSMGKVDEATPLRVSACASLGKLGAEHFAWKRAVKNWKELGVEVAM